jgi:ribosomal protein L36
MKIRNSLKSLKSRHRDCRVIRRLALRRAAQDFILQKPSTRFG